jgi:hypothetical protein
MKEKKTQVSSYLPRQQREYGSTKSSSVQVPDATICKTHKLMEKN